jgi:rhodanese-related sulfurtransferase
MSSAYHGVKHFQPLEAWNFLTKTPNAILIDVRERYEIEKDGYPDLKATDRSYYLIPWNNLSEDSDDIDFDEAIVQQIPDKENNVLLFICRAGARSQMAAEKAFSMGYKHCINIDSGFEGAVDKNGERNKISGWKFSSLPWEKN